VDGIEDFIVGNRATVKGTFQDADGNLADPSEVTITVKLPDRTTLIKTRLDGDLDNPTVGVWSYTLGLDAVGDYRFRIEGDGTLEAAGEGVFTVSSEF
jgi:hypothetical protein